MPPFGWGNGKTLALPLTSGKSFASSSPRSRGVAGRAAGRRIFPTMVATENI